MLLVDYYRAAPDIVQFNQFWCPDTTMMEKIKVGGFIEDLELQNSFQDLRDEPADLNCPSSSSGLSELPRTQRPGLLSDLGARLQSAEQHAVTGSALHVCMWLLSISS